MQSGEHNSSKENMSKKFIYTCNFHKIKKRKATKKKKKNEKIAEAMRVEKRYKSA